MLNPRQTSIRPYRRRRTPWRAVVVLLALAAIVAQGAWTALAQEPAAETPNAEQPAPPDNATPPPVDAPAGPAIPTSPSAPTAPFYEQDPFDRILLKDGNDLKVLPLEFVGRRRPENPRGSDIIIVRFPDKPAEKFELRWRDVQSITFWEEMVMSEADKLVAAGKFDAAYDYYAYLDNTHAGFDGVKQAIERYLFEEAKTWQRQAQYDRVLALLLELYDRNPQSPGLPRALGITTGKLIEKQLSQDEFPAARRLLSGLSAKYPDEASVLQWRGFFEQRSRSAVDEAQSQLAAGRIRQAHAAARRAMTIWPDLAAARTLFTDLNRRFPYVAVGVAQPAPPDPSQVHVLDDWAARRSRRLLHRGLFELAGYGVEGGEYRSPLGEMQSVDLGVGMNFRLRHDITWSPGGAVLGGADLARQLLALSDPKSPIYRSDWAELFASVEVPTVFETNVRLRRTTLRPEAMLQGPVIDWDAVREGRQPVPTDGPYRIESNAGDAIQYTLNENYFDRGPAQPHLVDERHIADADAAIKALRLGDILLLDRVNPWQLGKVHAIPNVTVASYGVPTVHCLIPNLARPLPANRQFRRALVYGINRSLILSRDLLDKRHDARSRVISGPFPLGYAYNDQVHVRPFDPNLARVLSRVALSELAKKNNDEQADAAPPSTPDAKTASAPAVPLTQEEQEAAIKSTKLIIALPAEDIARRACEQIARQLEAVLGLQVDLVELDPLQPPDQHPPHDLRYAELALWEPIVDARQLLGSGGLAGASNLYLDQALRQLAHASDWRTARDKLFEIHRLAAEDVTVVPLWQLTDYFAYHQDLEGIGEAPVSLYQEIERWQIAPLPVGVAQTDARAASEQGQP
ncbi:MAG: hypothetical protein KF708_08620 [Pirellulales bacterium]|nr:hypothetical protein [Pirellulales bacterium]